jgi:hypothetical protein
VRLLLLLFQRAQPPDKRIDILCVLIEPEADAARPASATSRPRTTARSSRNWELRTLL